MEAIVEWETRESILGLAFAPSWIGLLCGFIGGILGVGWVWGQDPMWLYPLRSGPMFRPAVIGGPSCIEGGFRAQMHWLRVTDYWTGRAAPFLTGTAYVGTVFPDGRNYTGFQVFVDRLGGGILQDLRLAFTFSHNAPFGARSGLVIGIAAGLRSLVWRSELLVFTSQLSPDGYDVVAPPPVRLPEGGRMDPLLTAGIGVYLPNFFVTVTAEQFYRWSQEMMLYWLPRLALDISWIIPVHDGMRLGLVGGGVWAARWWNGYMHLVLDVRAVRLYAGGIYVRGVASRGFAVVGIALPFATIFTDYQYGHYLSRMTFSPGQTHEFGLTWEFCREQKHVDISECP